MRHLKEVFQIAKEREAHGIGYVFDAPIHYIMLNREDNNTFDLDWLVHYSSVLDEIEASSGPGIMITICPD